MRGTTRTLFVLVGNNVGVGFVLLFFCFSVIRHLPAIFDFIQRGNQYKSTIHTEEIRASTPSTMINLRTRRQLAKIDG